MKLGIIGAMDVEVATLKEKMENIAVKTVAGMDYFEGMLEGLDCVVVQCGVGKINAAMCTQILVDRFAVTHIVNTGIAGSLCAELDIADLVISQDAIHHDFDLRFWGRPIGQVPGLDLIAFPADEMLQQAAFAASEAENPGHTKRGRVASGDQFICSKEQKEKIIADTGAICAEMEGASIAQVCYSNSMPFGVVRAISDRADGSGHIDYSQFLPLAAENAAKIIENFVKLYK